MNENDFVVGVLTYITCLREKKRYSTAKSYQDALRSFKCFCGREEIPYAYINRDTICLRMCLRGLRVNVKRRCLRKAYAC